MTSNHSRFTLLAVILLMSGCGLFKDRGGDYLKAEEMAPTVVPEGLDDSALGQIYRIPAVTNPQPLSEHSGIPRPQPVSVNVFEDQVKIQSIEEDRWILTNRSASETWPRVRSILNSSNIPVASANASRGLMDTVWLRFKDDDNYHRFRFTLEPGVQLNSTEIRVLHDQSATKAEVDAPWPAKSVDPDQEKSMVDSLAASLAGEEAAGASVSLLAQAIGGEAKVELVNPGVADPYILIKLDYGRSWASVSYSLSRGGFTTVDRDQSEGIFYVNYRSEEEEKPGFFRRLFGAGEEDVIEVNYLVLVKRGERGVEVRMTRPDHSSLDREQAQQLLKIVRSNLT